ncbi:unnamed protein product, partial [Pylaiella littoralis]
IVVSWDFDSSAEAWARASSVEMDAEVQWKSSGTIRGTVRGPAPHLDSPGFRVFATNRHYVVMRMRSSGAATLGRVELRTGRIPGVMDHSLNPWTTRGNVSVVVEESSSGGASNASFAADGDVTTIWETSGNTHEWVTLDLVDTREITALRLQAPGGEPNPRNFRFQQGFSAGGKFSTVANLTLGNSSEAQEFTVPSSSGRFWRIYVLDNYGANTTNLREVELLGPGDTTLPEPLDFEVFNDDAFHVYYVPIHRTFQGVLTQLRLRPGVEAEEAVGRRNASLSPRRGDAFEVDWIRIVGAPHVKRVRGCIDVAYEWPDTPASGRGSAGLSNITAANILVNGFLQLGRTFFGTVEGAEYGTTKSCSRKGGENITVAGEAFGPANAKVFIDGSPCSRVVHTPGNEETELTCISPAITAIGAAAMSAAASGGENGTYGFFLSEEWASTIEVVNGRMPGLTHAVRYLSYQAPPPPIEKPLVSNVAACSIDVSWEPPTDYWQALAITGYQARQVGWRSFDSGTNASEVEDDELGEGNEEATYFMTVGNVTTTTVRGLVPGMLHAFWVRALSEDRSDAEEEQVDLYGRRAPLPGAVAGDFGEVSSLVATLEEDILFESFNGNRTLNHSARHAVATLGPRGQWSGEGHYGLQLVGTAQIENCNRSTSCCDAYNDTTGSCSESGQEGAEGSPYLCAALATPGQQTWAFETDDSSVQPPLSGLSHSSSSSSSSSSTALRLPSSAVVVPRKSALAGGWGSGVSRACGPALRLTSSRPASAGAGWYPREVTVGEGFDTTFTFRLSSPSLRCNTMDDVYTHCRSRGADGVAFVVQGEGPTALGRSGMGLGYAGISNMLAVEFDTHYNPEMLEPFENHISVQIRDWRHAGSAHGSHSLGSTPNVVDLTDGELAARVKYTPVATPEDVFHPNFQASFHFGNFLAGGDTVKGGSFTGWGSGIGTLSVYVGDLNEPCLVVPLNLEAIMRLNHGRAFVGFTAGTGRDTWQVHDVLRWSLSSLREDAPNWSPPSVDQHNFDGAVNNTSCAAGDVCVATPGA